MREGQVAAIICHGRGLSGHLMAAFDTPPECPFKAGRLFSGGGVCCSVFLRAASLPLSHLPINPSLLLAQE